MAWSTIFDQPTGNTLWVPYDWKPNHEYMVYVVGLHKAREIECIKFYTFENTIGASDQAFVHRGYDSYIFLEQGANRGFRSVGFNSDSPILKILERPLAVGATSDDSDNWEPVAITPAFNLAYDWEDGYEYVVMSRHTENLYTWRQKSFITCSYMFASDAMKTANVGSNAFNIGSAFQSNVLWGFLWFKRKPGNPSSATGRSITFHNVNNTTRVSYIHRRKIKIVDKNDMTTKGWRLLQSWLPAGKPVGTTPFDWPYDGDVVCNSSDPYGTVEVYTTYAYTDKVLLENAAVKTKWNWTGRLTSLQGSSSEIWFLMPWVGNKGYKNITYRSKKGQCVLYEVLVRSEGKPVVELPDPEPEPPVPCEERCYIDSTIWQQTARVAVNFINPPDWANRTYDYVWGGDLGKGDIELVGTEEGGRVAIIRLVHTLVEAEAYGTLEFNINVTVTDRDYQQIGVKDSAECKLTFELPCVKMQNNPDINIEDVSIVEQHVTHDVPIRISLSEPYIGRDRLCVKWRTVDGTAVSDLRVKALAKDTGGFPFITVIETANRRQYIDGAFPKWYNGEYSQVGSQVWANNTLQFSKNLYTWLKGSSNKGKFLLMGDNNGNEYNVKGYQSSGFRRWWEDVATTFATTMDTYYVAEINALPDIQAFFDSYDCVIYFSSLYTGSPVLSNAIINAMKTISEAGVGIACIGDHFDAAGEVGFGKGANDFLISTFNVRMKGSIDRQGMNLLVEDFEPHALWANMSGKFASNGSEAYVDASYQAPDFISGNGTVCFNSGEDEKVVYVTILGDTIEEGDEQFTVELYDNTAGNIVKGVGVVTIRDDDMQPCGVSTPSGGQGVTETRHNLGETAGVVSLQYNMFSVPDMAEIFYNGNLVATTGGLVSGTGTLTFAYPGPGNGNDSFCMVRITGNNNSTGWNYTMGCPVVPPTDGGGGGGCVAFDTPISMADGSIKLVQDVVAGDIVMSVRVEGCPDSSDGSKDYLEWSTDDLVLTFSESIVVSNFIDSYDSYYECATDKSQIKITFEHPVMAKREGSWMWRRPETLMENDVVIHPVFGEVTILSIQRIEKHINTANLNVETEDNYFAGGFLVHNAENQKN